ncbi:MAG TPA: hypothetical protein DCM45_07430 [Clostridiales bacterium]|nr:hypothetical protein [Clostridiales bacterium]
MCEKTKPIRGGKARFAHGLLGSGSLQIRVQFRNGSAAVSLKVWLEYAPPRAEVRFCIEDYDETIVLCEHDYAETVLLIDPVRLEDEVNDPCLYIAKAELMLDGQVIDSITVNFACR